MLAEADAALIIREGADCGDRLCAAVTGLCEHPENRAKMEENIKKFASPDANRLIYNDIVKLVKKGKKA